MIGLGACLLAACVATSQKEKGGPAGAAKQTTGTARISFERQVKPVLESKCLSCHSGESAPWNFRLESRALAFQPGTSGPRIVPGKPEQSLVLSLASTHKNVAVMPLVGNRLTTAESKMLRQWVKEGAAWPEGRAGELKASPGSAQPGQSAIREEWKNWSSSPRGEQ